MASIVSWRGLRWRCSSSSSAKAGVRLDGTGGGVRASRRSGVSAMSGQVLQNVPEAMDLREGVVMDERGANDPALHGHTEAFHQSRRIHVAIANADTCAGHGLRNSCGPDAGQIKAKCRNAFADAVL